MHLGYGEKDAVRGEDSFDTFAEVFQIANERRVDMVLLAGDLFHDNKPSRKAMQRAMEVMRDHCLGERQVTINVVSDQGTNFHTKYSSVNYEDPNYNVQLPVFSIHGNHDDPAGDGGLAALDLLSTANLINYFGRVANFERIRLSPVLVTKGATKLALYGLGHVRDERLARCFERREVKVERPADGTNEWFSILALHQNRLPRGVGHVPKGYIKEQALPSCFDLVVWGHEHECLIGGGMDALTDSVENEFVVLQPGSTVATALVEGEARPKHVALLSICADRWHLEPIPLTTVRPFVIGEIVLQELDEVYDLHKEEELMRCLEERVEQMLRSLAAARQATPLAGADEARARYPLVRLKVDYTGYSTCNPQKFGQRFVDRVANPSEILLFQKTKVKRKEQAARAAAARRAGASAPLDDDGGDDEDPAEAIQTLVQEFLSDGAGKSAPGLRVLPQSELNTAVFQEFVQKDNKSAIRSQVEASLRAARAFLATELDAAPPDALSAAPAADGKRARDVTIEQLLVGRKRSARAMNSDGQGQPDRPGAPGVASPDESTPPVRGARGGGGGGRGGGRGGGGRGVADAGGSSRAGGGGRISPFGGRISPFDDAALFGETPAACLSPPTRSVPLAARSHGSTNAHDDGQPLQAPSAWAGGGYAGGQAGGSAADATGVGMGGYGHTGDGLANFQMPSYQMPSHERVEPPSHQVPPHEVPLAPLPTLGPKRLPQSFRTIPTTGGCAVAFDEFEAGAEGDAPAVRPPPTDGRRGEYRSRASAPAKPSAPLEYLSDEDELAHVDLLGAAPAAGRAELADAPPVAPSHDASRSSAFSRRRRRR